MMRKKTVIGAVFNLLFSVGLLVGLCVSHAGAATGTPQLLWSNIVGDYIGAGRQSTYALVEDVAVDREGNIYLTGKADNGLVYNKRNKSTFPEYIHLTIKTDKDGNVLWQRTYEEGGGLGGAIAVDSQGNLLRAGDVSRGGGYVVKYDPSGGLLWTRTYKGMAYASDIEVDASDNCFVAGLDSQNNWVTFKHSTDGDLLWKSSWPAGKTFANHPYDMAVDADGNVYVTGMFDTARYAWKGLAVVKYDSLGSEVWTRRYDAPYSDYGRGVDVDRAGNVYVAGTTTLAGSDKQALVQKYDADGNLIWSNIYPDSENAFAIKVNREGDIFVGGDWNGEHVKKLDPNGQVLWSNKFQAWGTVSAMAIDANDDLLLASRMGGSGTDGKGLRYIVRKLDDPLDLGIEVLRLAAGEVGRPYEGQIEVFGGTAPYFLSLISGTLPGGLAIDSSNGMISGIPSVPGAYDFTVQAVDASGGVATGSFSLVVDEPLPMIEGPEICYDGFDNDGNGKTDCSDRACRKDPACK